VNDLAHMLLIMAGVFIAFRLAGHAVIRCRF
jgi:hypothetical protein